MVCAGDLVEHLYYQVPSVCRTRWGICEHMRRGRGDATRCPQHLCEMERAADFGRLLSDKPDPLEPSVKRMNGTALSCMVMVYYLYKLFYCCGKVSDKKQLQEGEVEFGSQF